MLTGKWKIVNIWAQEWPRFNKKYNSQHATRFSRKTWRDTFGTSGAYFRRKILCPGQNIQILQIWSELPGCHPPLHSVTLHQWCIKFLSAIFYAFWGRKYRIGIFGHGAPQTDRKSWKETLRTTGAKFRMKILKFSNFTHLLAPCSKIPNRNFRP